MTGNDRLFNAEEEAAMKLIVEAMWAIKNLEPGLTVNNAELAQGVHVLQQFVIQHALARRYSGQFSNWYRGDEIVDAAMGETLP